MPHVSNFCPFSRVLVTVLPTNEKVVEWQLDPRFRAQSDPLEFFIESAYAQGEFLRLNPTAPVVDNCIFIDTRRYRFDLQNDVFYRIVFDDVDTRYESQPEPILGKWNNRDLQIARDITRKEILRLRYIGTAGFLLKKRTFGELCPTCRDFDTETVVTSNCPVCFGTKFVKGYFDAIVYPVDLSGTTSTRDVYTPFATLDNKQRNVRSVAFPRLDPYDVWVDAHKNKRYVVRSVTTAAEIKGRPLVFISQFREIPTTGIEFDVPLDQIPGSSSSTDQGFVFPDGWRQGIAYPEL